MLVDHAIALKGSAGAAQGTRPRTALCVQRASVPPTGNAACFPSRPLSPHCRTSANHPRQTAATTGPSSCCLGPLQEPAFLSRAWLSSSSYGAGTAEQSLQGWSRASRKQFEAEFSPWHNIGAAQDIPETPHPATQQPKDDFTAAAPEEDDADDQVNAHEVSFDINQGEINAADLDASFESSLRGMVMMPSEQPAAGGTRSMVSLPFEHEEEETQPQMKAKLSSGYR